MNVEELQARTNALIQPMLDKGLGRPNVELHIRANAVPEVQLSWAKTGTSRDWDCDYQWLKGDTVEAAFAKAEEYIANCPSPDQKRLKEFMSALGDVIDLGRANGIEVSYVNPLVETMKRLSENVLTHQAAE